LAPKSKHKKKQSNNLWLVAAAAIVTGGIIWFAVRSPGEPVSLANLTKPNVQTLSPDIFTGKTREAYQAAKEVPEVLHQMPCYCGCQQNPGHKSNLYCFADAHGADCSICQDIALDARDLYRSGETIEGIRETIRSRYARYAP
jgi:hypothetical protein